MDFMISRETAELLPRLAPSDNRQGQYVPQLIIRAAQEAGLIEAPPIPVTERLDLATLKQQIRAFDMQRQRLQTYIDAIEKQQGESDSHSPSF